MLDKVRNMRQFMSENRRFMLSVYAIILVLAAILVIGFLGTTSIMRRNVDENSITILNRVVNNVNNRLSESKLYVRMMADVMKTQYSTEDKMAEFEKCSDKIAIIFSGYYLGSYAECGKQVYNTTNLLNIQEHNWHDRCKNADDIISIYVETGEKFSDSYIVVAVYERDYDVLAATVFDISFLQDCIDGITDIDNVFNAAILDSEFNVLTANKGNMQAINSFANKYSDKEISEMLADNAISDKTYTKNVKTDKKTYRAYCSKLIDNLCIVLYKEKYAMYRDLYIFTIIQHCVLLISICLFVIFYASSYVNGIKAAYAMKTRSTFVANISHEIRTPLNAIIGMSEILLRRNINSAARNDVVAIHNAGTGLLAIINDILDYSKMESGNFKIIDDEYDLTGLVTEVINIVSFRIKDKDVRLLVNINPAVPKRLIGDEVRIKQILVNILGNAAKFTERGYITMSIDWDLINNGETNITIKIKDTGIGIDKKDLEVLFEEFVQADAGVRSKYNGTGLGLYISRNLAKQMNGSITAESVLGKGSTFTITFKNSVENYEPIAALADEEKVMIGLYEKDIDLAGQLVETLDLLHVKYRVIHDTKNDKDFTDLTHIFFRQKWKNEVGRKLGSLNISPVCILLAESDEDIRDENVKKLMLNLFGLQVADCINGEVKYFDRYSGFDTGDIVTISDARVLLVDDNITNMAVAKGILDAYNLAIDTAENGKQALEMVKNNVYDIVFMDNMMPVMDGVEATKKIREFDGDYYKNLPIVALTALAGRGDRERFQGLGFDEFLSKPIDLNKMDIILHKFLQNKIKDIYAISDTKLDRIDDIEQDLTIDTVAGIRQMGQSVDAYIDVLTIFAMDMEKRCTQLLTEKSIERFVINVHAIKGSAASVGAYRLNEMAAELEILGKENETEQIKNKINGFIDQLNLTIQSAREYISEYKNSRDMSKDFRPAVDRLSVEAIIHACGNMDMIAIEDVFSKITKFVYPENTMKILENIKMASFDYDYDRILKFANQLKK